MEERDSSCADPICRCGSCIAKTCTCNCFMWRNTTLTLGTMREPSCWSACAPLTLMVATVRSLPNGNVCGGAVTL